MDLQLLYLECSVFLPVRRYNNRSKLAVEVSVRELIPQSGYYYPNKMARIFLLALEEVMGRNGLNALLNLINLREYIHELPPDNLEREFDFAHISNINIGLEEIYGPRGGRGLALRGGRAIFSHGLKGFGALAGVGDLAFKVLPLKTKLRIGVPAVARIFTQFSDQTSRVEDHGDHFLYYIDRCSMCWGRSQCEKPVGFVAVGILQETLRWVSGGLEFRVEELECICQGAESGVFRIDKEPIR